MNEKELSKIINVDRKTGREIKREILKLLTKHKVPVGDAISILKDINELVMLNPSTLTDEVIEGVTL